MKVYYFQVIHVHPSISTEIYYNRRVGQQMQKQIFPIGFFFGGGGGGGGCLLGGTLGGGVNGLIFIVTFLFEYECNKSDFSMGMGYKVVFWNLYMYIHS